jgi:hypothetical protein
LLKMLATCFSTAPPDTTSSAAMPAFDLPSAISASTCRSRGVSVLSPPRCLLARNSWLTTSGSSAVPPSATRCSAAANSATLATRSLSR